MNDPVAEYERQPMAVADRLARKIKQLRLNAGLSQRALAAKIGYSRQYVSMTEWEDANLPSRELVAAIDTALDANGSLIALRRQAKNDQQIIRRQPSCAFVDSSSLDYGPIELPGVEELPLLLDPHAADVAKSDPGQHPHELTAVSAVYPCQAEVADEVRRLAKEAGAIDIMAIRGLGILGLNDSLLRKTIPRGTQLRVLLLNPDSAAVAHRAEEIGESTESFAAGIRLAIARIEELAALGRPVEVYLYDQIPVWRIIRIDEVLFVSAFNLRYEGHTSPIHRIEPNALDAFHFAFVRTLEQAFSQADQVV
ncbi:helix-turn-helix transcriptional regulator [Nocardia sp. CA-129566]|uniref:helix-turn-helix transcriptional regulator n=1 Tax=Nocardia sp. CA-129566 TaxID=3239976 RepID=UPI003D96F2E7